ncbi:MAG: Ig-like domain repeat protein [Terracidiphilus sp.]
MVDSGLRHCKRGKLKDGLRRKHLFAAGLLALAASGAALLLAGCGNFWQAPTSTGTTSTGTTATSTALVPSTTTAATGDTVTLTATVTPSAATGTVTFYNGSISIGTSSLASGTATISPSFTSAGTESLTATYGGSSTYASSTSSAVTVTVSTARKPVLPGEQTAAIQTSSAFNATGKTYAASNAEAAVIAGNGAITLVGATLSGANGDDRGVLLYQPSPAPGSSSFSMTRGSLAYNCDATATPACAQGSTSADQNNPATLFAIANDTATVSLTDVQVTDGTATAANPYGTLLTAQALNAGAWGTAGTNGGNVVFTAQGTALTGDVIVGSASTAALSILEDSSGTGSTLTGAIDSANTAKSVTLTLDPASLWVVTGTSYVTNLMGLDLNGASVNNIDGGGHCVYYSGSIDGAASSAVYSLGGGGYLAPVGTSGLNCN